MDRCGDILCSDGYLCDSHGNCCSNASISVDIDLFSQSLADIKDNTCPDEPMFSR